MEGSNLLVVVAPAAVILIVAYFVYGRILSRLLRLDDKQQTPAVTLRDDEDYSPIEPKFLMSQHFSAIAAAGPIVGPILAGMYFGWGPAIIWILLGSIFIGGVHDMTALVASIRHKARSIAEVVREHMSRRSFLLFLSFVWLALVYIIVAFTDITADAFVGNKPMENGEVVPGAAIASSSLLYLLLPVIMGLLMRYTKLSLNVATLIFVPLIIASVYVGQFIPFRMESVVEIFNPSLEGQDLIIVSQKVWDVLLLAYCIVAAMVPMWMLLQPRGHLGGYFLYVTLGACGIGLLFGGETIQYPAFTGWSSEAGGALFPMLFITIACGACSGFHSLIASGTTSKQLRRESDAKVIGYGTMLLEGFVAIISLCCVMMLAQNSSPIKTGVPNLIYATGLGNFLAVMGIPPALAISFALMAFSTFVFDTLDVCTRLGRYIIQELTGMPGTAGKWLGTILTAGVPIFFMMQTLYDDKGKVIPIWKSFWALFGASNQLLAALSLLGVTVWLWRTRREKWVWFVTGIPTLLMYTMSTWALVTMIGGKLTADGFFKNPLPWDNSKPWLNPVTVVAVLLVVLAALMAIEAVRVIISTRKQPPTEPQRGVVPATA